MSTCGNKRLGPKGELNKFHIKENKIIKKKKREKEWRKNNVKCLPISQLYLCLCLPQSSTLELEFSPYLNPTITHFGYLKPLSPSLPLSFSLSPSLSLCFHIILNMSRLSFRSLTFMFFIAFLVWSSSIETCNARRGKHWRQSRASSSLSKKKGKSYSNGNHRLGGGSKPKAPKSSSHKAPPVPATKPKEDFPSSPPQKGYNGGHSASTFNVLDFGAKGDGSTDDTQVILQIFITALFFFSQNIKKEVQFA